MDEAPDRPVRERFSRLIEHVTRTYGKCRFVVTSHPAAYTGDVVLPDFAQARIDPLSDEVVEAFLGRWCQAIYAGDARSAGEHLDELLSAVRARREIRRMARNPVMLTALAVVHGNERRLPEQRADLYDSILRWLSRSREQRAGRETAERTVVVLQELALAMRDDPAGRKTQVPKRWAAEKIAAELSGTAVSKQTVDRAERFLDEEELDSGIVVGRGHEVAFWHLTFQEFLAAKAVAARLEDEQERLLFADRDKLYLPDWREVGLLLAGALHQQGKAKVDGLVSRLLDGLDDAASLADRARCAGLIGGLLRDLAPLDYEISDPRYATLLDAVQAIFDRERSQTVPIAERIAAADALGQAGDPRIDFAREDYWVSIPAGTFRMGSQKDDPRKPNYDPEMYDREGPVHEVDLDAYRIARYPVTVDQYRRFVEDDGYEEQRWWTAGGFGQFTQPDGWDAQLPFPSRPVVSVSWFEAAAFCVWARCRLPTEAQWERAARGTQGRKFPWGNEPADPSRLNYDDSKIGHPTPVGIHALGATPEGIQDMAGNVWEWCADWFERYRAEAVSNPCGPEDATYRVFRGGSWAYVARLCRSAFRHRWEPAYRREYLDFRVVAAVRPAVIPRTGASPAEPGAQAEGAQGR